MTTEKWAGEPIGPLYTIDEASADIKASRSTVYELIKGGELEAVKAGSATRITHRSREAYKRSLPRLNTSESPRAA
jgi:excisionase family DNA binding protein